MISKSATVLGNIIFLPNLQYNILIQILSVDDIRDELCDRVLTVFLKFGFMHAPKLCLLLGCGKS
jgi:hypothetical protein